FLEMEFDFIDHQLTIKCSDGARRSVELGPKSVARFYQETMTALDDLGLPVRIWKTPVEIPDPIPFDQDFQHASYDPVQANKCWRILRHADRVMQEFRSRFIGKCSPVHFFWGSFDLAVTRFSGRRAPEHPSVPNTPDFVVREAYSHEVSSAGFWPGSAAAPEPVFYSYAYPEPEGFAGW